MYPNLKSTKLSIVVPLYNEEKNLDCLFKRLTSVLNKINISYEIVCVNDGSKDNTLKCLIEQNRCNTAIKVVNLSRNFGKEIALTAGIDYSTGAAVIKVDAV